MTALVVATGLWLGAYACTDEIAAPGRCPELCPTDSIVVVDTLLDGIVVADTSVRGYTISVRELIDEYCDGMQDGHELYAYLPGGASGGILPARLGEVALDFDTLQPHGAFIGSAAVIVLSQHDRARDAAVNLLRFFADESCGQCPPCRVGTEKAVALMGAPTWDTELLGELAQAMADASICGLGQAAPNPFTSVIRYRALDPAGKPIPGGGEAEGRAARIRF